MDDICKVERCSSVLLDAKEGFLRELVASGHQFHIELCDENGCENADDDTNHECVCKAFYSAGSDLV